MKKKLLVFMTVFALLIMTACGSAPEEDQTAADDQTAREETVQEEAVQDEDADTEIAASGEISEKQAKEIALKHAGLKEKDVKFTKVKKEKDDGILKYEIEFISGDKEYEYDISAADGTILEYDVDNVDDD